MWCAELGSDGDCRVVFLGCRFLLEPSVFADVGEHHTRYAEPEASFEKRGGHLFVAGKGFSDDADERDHRKCGCQGDASKHGTVLVLDEVHSGSP